MSKKLAWQVRENSDDHCCVVFHHHGLAARRIGADDLGRDFEHVDCIRAPQFDQYAEFGKVPQMALLESGWWIECSHCGHKVMNDDGRTLLDEVVVVEHSVYCNKSCRDGHDKEKADRESAFHAFKESVKTKRPDLIFTEFKGGWPLITMTAKFKFPGSKFGGGSAIDRNGDGEVEWYIAYGDIAAFSKYEESRRQGDET